NTTAVTINRDTANSTNMFGNNVKGDIVIGDAVKNQTNIYIVGNLFSYISPMKLYNLNESEMRSVFYSDRNPYVVLFELVHCHSDRGVYHNMYYINDNKLL